MLESTSLRLEVPRGIPLPIPMRGFNNRPTIIVNTTPSLEDSREMVAAGKAYGLENAPPDVRAVFDYCRAKVAVADALA